MFNFAEFSFVVIELMASTTRKGRDFFRMLRESKLDFDDEAQSKQTNIAQSNITMT